MKTALVVAALAASVAVAGPLERRQHTTVATVTVTIDFPSQTPGQPAPAAWHFYYGWWNKFRPTPTASSGQTSSSAPAPSSSAAGQFYSAAPTTSQASLNNQEPTSTQSLSSSSPSGSAQPAQSTSAQSTASQIGDSWQGDEPYSMSYAKPIIDAHNSHRANHSVPNLKWSRKMEEYARQISATCIYAHSKAIGDGEYGQNIGAGFAAEDVAYMITNGMYNGEIRLYPGPYGGEPDMSNFEAWGHYSQIVWADTQEVGCYTTQCDSGLQNVEPNVGKVFTVCNYYPTGNWLGQYGAKVPRPGNMPTITLSRSH